MPDKTTHRRIYFFDLVAAASALMVGAGQVVVHAGRQSAWNRRELLGLGVYGLAFLSLAAFRRQAYTQAKPWLVGFFSASAIAAIVVTFWPWSTVWLIGAAGAGATMFLAAVVRRKAVSDPITRGDVAKMGALAAGALVALGAAESILRVAPGILGHENREHVLRNTIETVVPHPYVGQLYKPHSVIRLYRNQEFDVVQHNDAVGFRNASPWPERADIVVVGDSVVTGFGAADEETWPAALARSLPGSRVVNLGLGGSSPLQSLRIYETFGVKLLPRLVLVGVHVQDDYWDSGMFDSWVKSGIGGNYAVWRDFAGRPATASLKARVKLHVYSMALNSRLYNLIDSVRASGGPPEVTTVIRLPDGSSVQLLPRDFDSKKAAADPSRPEFQLVVQALRKIHALAEKNGARALVVLEPGKEEVYLPLLDPAAFDPTRALRHALDELGIDYLDLGPEFRRRAAAGERLFFREDRHPNPAGYALIAKLVRERIIATEGAPDGEDSRRRSAR